MTSREPAEDYRLARLRECEVLDTEAEDAFDRVARLASRILDMPIALVSLVDAERQWFKARIGLAVCETPRDVALCDHTIRQDQPLVIEDTRTDPRFAANPLVTHDPGIRFYAGAPLILEDGVRIGSLCVIDLEPRAFGEAERQLLRDLAAIVVDELELRRLARQARETELRFVEAVEALPDGFVLYDREDRLVLCNRRYREMYAESASLLVPGTPFATIIREGVKRGQYPAAAGREEAWIAQRLRDHARASEAIEQQLPGDRWLRILESRTGDGGTVGVRVDITALKRQERVLQELAWIDQLTRALTRHRFLDTARVELDRAARQGTPTSLLLLDIDHFKTVNDRYGHHAGDQVLSELAGRWHTALRSHDVLGRLGGEEFAVLAPDTDLDGGCALAERLRQATAETPVAVDPGSISVTVSVGVASLGSTPGSLDRGLLRVDQALYAAKRAGRDRVDRFDPETSPSLIGAVSADPES